MNYLQLLVADRVRSRAQDFRNYEKNRLIDELEAAGVPVEQKLKEWNAANDDVRFIKMAYEELQTVIRVMETCQPQ